MEVLEAENNQLREELEKTRQAVIFQQKAREEAEAKLSQQETAIREAQMAIYLYEQDIDSLLNVAEWYQLKCVQSSEVLDQVKGFLQNAPCLGYYE